MTRALLVVLALLAGCERPTPKRVAPRTPLRTPPGPRGPMLAGDPTPMPSARAVLEQALLLPVSDGRGEVLQDDHAVEGELAMLAGVWARGGDDDLARTVLKVRRAAFGVHVPAAGERGVIDDDVLEDRGLAIEASAVALLGPEGPCLAVRRPPVVTAVDLGGNVIDVRWPLQGCAAGSWAPVGLVAQKIPTTLRWVPRTCGDDGIADAAWADIAAERLGVVLDGDAVVALVGELDGVGMLWIAGDDGWRVRQFGLGGARALGCGAPVEAPIEAPDLDAAPQG